MGCEMPEEVPALRRRADRVDKMIQLDPQLRRLATVDNLLSYRLGLALEPLMTRFVNLGRVSRAADYAREFLGMGVRTTQRLRRRSKGVDRFPLLRSALFEGKLSQVQVDLLLTHLERHPDEEEVRVEQATRLTVRALGQELQLPREEDGQVVREYLLTRQDLLVWRDTLELCRRVAGSQLSFGQALEFIAADYLAQAPLPFLEPELPPQRTSGLEDEREREAEEAARGWDFLDSQAAGLPELDALLASPLPEDLNELEQHVLGLCAGRISWGFVWESCWRCFRSGAILPLTRWFIMPESVWGCRLPPRGCS